MRKRAAMPMRNMMNRQKQNFLALLLGLYSTSYDFVKVASYKFFI